MNIVLNGKTTTLDERATVIDLLRSLGLADKRVAVEINGEIVPRSQHASHAIAASDQIEVVVAVGGG